MAAFLPVLHRKDVIIILITTTNPVCQGQIDLANYVPF